LGDAERIRKARVHPIAVLAGLLTYRSGVSVRGSNTWSPIGQIVDALDGAFYASFGNVEPTGKRLMLALDVSGSMTMGNVGGVPGLAPREASAAMALITAAVEKSYQVVGFTSDSGYRDTGLTPLAISPRQRLDDAVRTVSGLQFGGTDCSLPMTHALDNGLEVDAFVVYTDNETWAGRIHPSQALRQYRAKTGINAKLVVVGMTADRFSIADPKDAGMLDVVGFDTATPNAMSEFIRG
jgi:60 kDa SS-A/Ro ribonucleoprotein